MYTHFIASNSSSPYYHGIFQNGGGGETEEREQTQQQSLQPSETSQGLNFSNYLANQSLSNMIKNQKMSQLGANSNPKQQSQIYTSGDQGNPLHTQINNEYHSQSGQQKDDVLLQVGQEMANKSQSKSFKKRRNDQTLISSFARSTPQFYTLSKQQQQQIQHNNQQNQNEMNVTNNANNTICAQTNNNNITGFIHLSDKEKINQISKIYSSHFSDQKRIQRKQQQIQSDQIEKKSSPLIEKKGSPLLDKNIKVQYNPQQQRTFVEQQFYSTATSAFPTKNSSISIHKVEDKQLYVFQQQPINFLARSKKASSISSFQSQNQNIEHSQRLQSIDDNYSSNKNLHQNKPQKSIIKPIKNDKKNSYNVPISRSDSQSKYQQSINQSQFQITGINNNPNNLAKKSISSVQKIFIQQTQHSLNKIQSPSNQQENIPTNQFSSLFQGQTTQSFTNITNKQERFYDTPSTLVYQKNQILIANQNQPENNPLQLARNQSHNSLSKTQTGNNQQNNQKRKNNNQIPSSSSHRQFNKSSSMIYQQSSYNLKSSEDLTGSDDTGPLTDHIKLKQTNYQQHIQQQNETQNQISIRNNQTRKSLESSPQQAINHLKNQSETFKRPFTITQIQNKQNKSQGILQIASNLRRQSSISSKQYIQSSNEQEQSISGNLPNIQFKNEKINNSDSSQSTDIQLSHQLSGKNNNNNNNNNTECSEINNTDNMKKTERECEFIKFDQNNKIKSAQNNLDNSMLQYQNEQNSYMNISKNPQRLDDKMFESHRLILKKSSSQKVDSIPNLENNTKKQSQTQIFGTSTQIIDKCNEQSSNTVEIKKSRKMSNTQPQNSQIQREFDNKADDEIHYEQKSFIINRHKLNSRSPQKNYKSNQYPENQCTDSTAMTYTHHAEEEENKQPLSKQNILQKYKYPKNVSLHYQPSYNQNDYSPHSTQITNNIQDYSDKKKMFSDKIQELRDIKKNSNKEQEGQQYKVSFPKASQNNQQLEKEDFTPVRQVPLTQVSSRGEIKQIIDHKDETLNVPQQIFDAISLISSNRPKTSEGGSRKRGIRLNSKMQLINAHNNIKSEQAEDIQSEQFNVYRNNKEVVAKQQEQYLQRLYATHSPSMPNQFDSKRESGYQQQIVKSKSQNEKNAFDSMYLPSNFQNKWMNKQNDGKFNNPNLIQNLLVSGEEDLGIEEFQIKEMCGDISQNEDYTQTKKKQQQLMKNNNFLSDLNSSSSHKILIRHNKSSSQTKRQISSRQQNGNQEFQGQERIDESIHKPKGSHLQSDFLSLFAQ